MDIKISHGKRYSSIILKNSFLVSYVTLKPESTIKIMYQQVLYYHIQTA